MVRIILKDELRRVPFFGWAFQMLMYVFLKRNRDVDPQWIDCLLSYFIRNDLPVSLLLFPEGTDFSDKEREVSAQWAVTNGLENYRQVLHPRTLGFVEVVRLLRGHLDAVYDLTLGYQYFTKDERPSDVAMPIGRFPPKVAIYLERIPIDTLPEDDEALHAWCRERELRGPTAFSNWGVVFCGPQPLAKLFHSYQHALPRPQAFASRRSF